MCLTKSLSERTEIVANPMRIFCQSPSRGYVRPIPERAKIFTSGVYAALTRPLPDNVQNVMRDAISKSSQDQQVDWAAVENNIRGAYLTNGGMNASLDDLDTQSFLTPHPMSFLFAYWAYKTSPRVLLSLVRNAHLGVEVLTTSDECFGGGSLLQRVAEKQDESFVAAVIPQRTRADFSDSFRLMNEIFTNLCEEFSDPEHPFPRGLVMIFEWLASGSSYDRQLTVHLCAKLWSVYHLAMPIAKLGNEDVYRSLVPLVESFNSHITSKEVLQAWISIKTIRDAICDAMVKERWMFDGINRCPHCKELVQEVRMRTMMLGLCQDKNVLCEELTCKWLFDTRVLAKVADFVGDDKDPVPDHQSRGKVSIYAILAAFERAQEVGNGRGDDAYLMEEID